MAFEPVVVDPGMAGDCKAVGDIDGDGLKDLVIGGRPNEGLKWYRNPDWTMSLVAVPAGEFTTDCALADMDGDGDLDIVVPDATEESAILWFSNPRVGDGAPGEWRRNVVGTTGGPAHDVRLGDFDRDGRIDIATRNPDEAMLFFQSETGWVQVVLPGVPDGLEGLGSGDIDGDGDPDLVLWGVWVENPGKHAARDAARWRVHPIGPAPPTFKAIVVDIDRNGTADVVYASSEQVGPVSWWTPIGGPTGAWRGHRIAKLDRAHTLQSADMDGDGTPDLIVGQMHTAALPRILLFRNVAGNGGTWTAHEIARTGIHNGVVADIDGDGRPDVFGSNWTGNPPTRLWLNRSGAARGSASRPLRPPAGSVVGRHRRHDAGEVEP